MTRDETTDSRARLAAALRQLISLTVTGRACDEDLEEVIHVLEVANTQLAEAEARAVVGMSSREAHTLSTSAPNKEEFFKDYLRSTTSPVTGRHNPLAPPVQLSVIGATEGSAARISGEVEFSDAYEGVPQCVHGGVLAAMFDEVLGAANLASENPGMTGTIKIRFHRPTPIRRLLRIEASWLRREGRKNFSWAGIFDGDELTAEAEGLFVEITQEQFLAFASVGNITGTSEINGV